MNEYEARLEERRARLLAAAERAELGSDAAYKGFRDIMDPIPMGQPILVGHHSERRHRNAIARAEAKIRKSAELGKKAAELKAKAAAVGSAGISYQDPEAAAKIKNKIRELEKKRDLMKAANKAYKLAVKMGINDTPRDELLIADLEKIAEKTGLRYGDLLIKAVTWKPEYSFEKGPYAGWPLKNLGANIRRYEKRLKELEALAAEDGIKEQEVNGVTLKEEDGRVMFVFPGKPDDGIRSLLKARAFKWSPSRKAWVRGATINGRAAAEHVMKEMTEKGMI